MTKASMAVVEAEQARRRKRWPQQVKRRIVEETLKPGASVAGVARANDVNANQVHAWRRLYERGLLGTAETAALLPVRVIAGNESLDVARVHSGAGGPDSIPRSHRRRPSGVIQIEVERGRLRIEGAVDPASLRVVLECLLG